MRTVVVELFRETHADEKQHDRTCLLIVMLAIMQCFILVIQYLITLP